MPPLEAWEKVLIDGETFLETDHGQLACIDCHGGEGSSDKTTAHNNLIADPSENPQTACAECHEEIVHTAASSLHSTLEGYWTVLNSRADTQNDLNHEALTEMFGNHCAKCHASCGDCHVSQPSSVGGGLISGHVFNATPSLTRNCTACHGSRIGNEYLGKHEGINADIHFRSGRMSCVDCHAAQEMHGQTPDCQACHAGPEDTDIPPANHRYDGLQQPRCETCHAYVTLEDDPNTMHGAHGSDLACQVCHAASYTSCDSCHVALSETTGLPFFTTEGSYLTFLIGRNPNPTFDRPYRFVPVRHVPIDPESFRFYGDDLLPFFDTLPTWKYTTPHNIQLMTPQSRSCNSCHGNPDLFLTADKVRPEELEANLSILIETIPAPVGTDNP